MHDYIVVGSGINGLVCAAMLGRRGYKVLLLERNPQLGGCLLTGEITAPGFVHDVMATTFVLFVTSRPMPSWERIWRNTVCPSANPTCRPACCCRTGSTPC